LNFIFLNYNSTIFLLFGFWKIFFLLSQFTIHVPESSKCCTRFLFCHFQEVNCFVKFFFRYLSGFFSFCFFWSASCFAASTSFVFLFCLFSFFMNCFDQLLLFSIRFLDFEGFGLCFFCFFMNCSNKLLLFSF